MVDLTESQKQELAILRERLARVERNEVFAGNRPGAYTPQEKATEIARIKAQIARIEAGDS